MSLLGDVFCQNHAVCRQDTLSWAILACWASTAPWEDFCWTDPGRLCETQRAAGPSQCSTWLETFVVAPLETSKIPLFPRKWLKACSNENASKPSYQYDSLIQQLDIWRSLIMSTNMSPYGITKSVTLSDHVTRISWLYVSASQRLGFQMFDAIPLRRWRVLDVFLTTSRHFRNHTLGLFLATKHSIQKDLSLWVQIKAAKMWGWCYRHQLRAMLGYMLGQPPLE